ncbi:MAG: hypothetical protein DMF68_15240 [Acidobacteria bacterium]|nr:MAG: hypothetical protein DMF68_15240 [Acidobacteriota bacterium]
MNTCPKCGEQYHSAQTFCTRDGEVLQDDHAGMIGRVLDGQYQIEEFIGEGGMGTVYRARHTLLSDKVAIKILPPEMRRNTAWLKRFQREGQAARRFHHPNSVMVHDLRTSSEGEIYLVMEYVEGGTLDEEVAARGGRLSLDKILQIVEAVASVLDAAHEQGVVHRDLKPSNIMITNRGTVKLLDLGVAKVTDMEDSATQLTATGQLLGTPYFMSPEQWGEIPRDGGEEIDGRTDIYSLGVVTYKLTAGELPFKGTSIVALHRAHCHQAPRPLEEFNGSVPPAWSRAVLRAALGGAELWEESTLAAAQTVVTERQSTSPVVHETPNNLNAQTVHSYDKAHAVQLTTPPSYQPAPVQIPARKSSNSTLIIVAVVALLILGLGGFAFWKWRSDIRAERRRAANAQSSQASNSEADTKEATANTNSQTASGDNNDAATGNAFMRYHLLLTKEVLDESVTASGRDPIASGQIAQRLDSASGTENFMVFFTDKPLAFPFVNEPLPMNGGFRKLTVEEQRAVEELKKESVPASVQFDADAAVVKLASAHGSKPVVFDITLKLKRP